MQGNHTRNLFFPTKKNYEESNSSEQTAEEYSPSDTPLFEKSVPVDSLLPKKPVPIRNHLNSKAHYQSSKSTPLVSPGPVDLLSEVVNLTEVMLIE